MTEVHPHTGAEMLLKGNTPPSREGGILVLTTEPNAIGKGDFFPQQF